jgi:hypothetical protein
VACDARVATIPRQERNRMHICDFHVLIPLALASSFSSRGAYGTQSIATFFSRR